MGNINIKLLESKRYIAEYKDVALTTDEPDYHIVAGEDDATTFTISKPTEYESGYNFFVEMVNAANYGIESTLLESGSDKYWIKSETQFSLPVGMAVAGYAYISIYATPASSATSNEKVVWMPVKIKVWNTIPAWSQEVTDSEYVTKEDFNAFRAAVDENLIIQGGDIAFTDLPTPSSSNVMTQYNVTDDFVTDERFIEGAGHTHTAGTNVLVRRISEGIYRYDALAGQLDDYTVYDGTYPLMSVGYAVEAGHSDESDHADEADHALEADHTLEADHADNADHATEADHAISANKSTDSSFAEKLGTSANTVSAGDSEHPVYLSEGVPYQTEDVFLYNYGSQQIKGNLIIAKEDDGTGGAMTVQGDLTVIGKTISASQESLLVGSTTIVTNNNGVNLETLGFSSGLAIRTGNNNDTDIDKEAFGIVYNPVSQTVEGGFGSLDADNNFSFDVDENHALAFRAKSNEMTNGNIMAWSSDGNVIVDSGLAKTDIVTKQELEAEANARIQADAALGDRIDNVIDGSTPVAKAEHATNATNDGDGNEIKSTYVPWSSVDSEATANTVPRRDDNGCIDTATPVNASNASNKGYTDAQSAISRYHLGAFDTYVDNGDGTATITRATYYLKIDSTVDTGKFHIEDNRIYIDMSDKTQCVATKDNPNDTVGDIRTNQGICVTPGQTWTNIENGVSYYNVSPTFNIQISKNFMGQTLNTVEAAQEYFGAHPLCIQLKLATPYTENVISARPINTLDQQAMWDVREEWEKGLNVFDDSDIRGYSLTTSSLFLRENAPFKIEAGTYTTCAFVSGGQKVPNTFLILLFGDDTEVSMIGSVGNAANTYCTVTITAEQASKINKISIYYNAQSGELSGQELIGIMMVKGSATYPYRPYHGGILRPTDAIDIAANAASATRLSRTYEVDNPSGLDGAWVSVGYVTMSTASAYSNYSIIFLLNGLFNSQGIDNPACSGQLELDVRQDLTNYTPTLSVLSGNIETNRFCCMREGHIIWLYMYCSSQYSRTRYVVLNEAVPNFDTGNFETFTFDSTHQSTSAPSGAVYAVNRNTSSLEANGGTVNGDINVTGTVSEQGQRVYSPNNPQPNAPTTAGTDSYLWESNGADSEPSWQAPKIRNINGDAERGKNIYAPTGAGNIGNLLVSGGYGVAPEWRECANTENLSIYRATSTTNDIFDDNSAYSNFATVADCYIELPKFYTSGSYYFIRTGGFYIPTGTANTDYIYRFSPPSGMQFASLQASFYRVEDGNASLGGDVTPNLSCYAERSGNYYGYVGVDWESFNGGGIYVQYVAVSRALL